MNISRFAELTGLSADTLRYYEKIGLMTGVRRSVSGHRDYSSRDLEWVGFIVRLKETGMPLSEIKTYAILRDRGDSTMNQRRQLLEQHLVVLERQVTKALEHRDALRKKIEHYHRQESG
ncbi:MAG: MerR family transcriptional regulator [Alteromonadaceae bacterium]|nr:MerR family transcriptional regulator [Alteromonadaceae bacterium]MBH83910.1 MerR family transcriptional regulator [Alteromonadaceae bacterium]|tara:strand:- start:22229 stop:22585 length:357 start_codon:yes stop_codon:yes gene_type:complete